MSDGGGDALDDERQDGGEEGSNKPASLEDGLLLFQGDLLVHQLSETRLVTSQLPLLHRCDGDVAFYQIQGTLAQGVDQSSVGCLDDFLHQCRLGFVQDLEHEGVLAYRCHDAWPTTSQLQLWRGECFLSYLYGAVPDERRILFQVGIHKHGRYMVRREEVRLQAVEVVRALLAVDKQVPVRTFCGLSVGIHHHSWVEWVHLLAQVYNL